MTTTHTHTVTSRLHERPLDEISSNEPLHGAGRGGFSLMGLQKEWRSVQGKARERRRGGGCTRSPLPLSVMFTPLQFFFPSSALTVPHPNGWRRRAWSSYLPCVCRACPNPSMTHEPPSLRSVESPPVGSGCVSRLGHGRKPVLEFNFTLSFCKEFKKKKKKGFHTFFLRAQGV